MKNFHTSILFYTLYPYFHQVVSKSKLLSFKIFSCSFSEGWRAAIFFLAWASNLRDFNRFWSRLFFCKSSWVFLLLPDEIFSEKNQDNLNIRPALTTDLSGGQFDSWEAERQWSDGELVPVCGGSLQHQSVSCWPQHGINISLKFQIAGKVYKDGEK